MAVDMFLKIDTVSGESVPMKDHIDILTWTWGMTQSATTHTSQGGGAGKVNVNDITITKHIDKASPVLIKACCTGQHFKTASVIVRKAGGDKALDYLTLNLEDVLVSGYSTAGAGSDDRIVETITLNFGRFKIEYKPQGNLGSIQGGKVTSGFDIAANAPL
jgi:type VI secretion system secreted protein Hcp